MCLKKNYLLYGILVLILGFSFESCGTKKISLEEQARRDVLREHVEARDYTFTATSVSPLNFRSINLTSVYWLEVSKDTIKVNLPYFGRAYTPPVNPSEIGINFISTDFDYEVKLKKDMWEITITPKDVQNIRKLFLSIGNTGYANLSIQQDSRQAISYYGTVE